MSLATAADGPEAKKFRFSLPTQVRSWSNQLASKLKMPKKIS
jgi:hypothetical protein